MLHCVVFLSAGQWEGRWRALAIGRCRERLDWKNAWARPARPRSAQRDAMSDISEYFEEVPATNSKAAMADPGDLRLAINAIMTLDGFFGTLHTELFKTGVVTDESDDKWKETLARSCHHYRVLRDAAYALKHGTLTHPKRRLVRRFDQILTMPASFDSVAFDRSAFDTGRVWIEAEDTDYEADKVINTVLDLARDWLSKVPD
jgi:hypothetical protein